MTRADTTAVGMPGFVGSLSWGDVPPAVRERLGWLMLDAAAAAEAGRRLDAARIIAEYAVAAHGGGDSTCLYDGRRASAPGAALANGTLMNAVDIDDGHSLAKGHPGAVVIPAALAVAEQVNATATEFATAALIGYEIAIRAALKLHARTAVFHSSATYGAIGAAAAAAHLLGLGAAEIGSALGLAEYHAPMDLVMRAVAEPTMAKDAMGWAALTGVASALLAGCGFTAHTSEFEVAGDRHVNATLGRDWLIGDVYVKPYPCCRWAHPALDAARELKESHGGEVLRAATAVEITTFDAAASLSTAPPQTSEQAQFNLRWPVACALVTGRFDLESITTDLGNPEITAMHERIVVTVDPRHTAWFPAVRATEVTVTTPDGTRLTAGVDRARGEAADPGWTRVISDKAAALLGVRVAPGAVLDDPSPEFRLGGLDAEALTSVLRYPLAPPGRASRVRNTAFPKS